MSLERYGSSTSCITASNLSVSYYFLCPAWLANCQLAPTKKQLEEENLDKNLLFKYVPALKGKVAWREIGNYPTPVHKLEIQDELSFYVKREDLSNSSYGGNKVRTLQHLIGSAEAFAEKTPGARFMVTGSSGSNQCVAATVHGLKTSALKMEAFWAMEDEPEMDNTLNMLSVLSYPVPWTTHSDGLKKLRNVIDLLTKKEAKVFNLGGNNIAGMYRFFFGKTRLLVILKKIGIYDGVCHY